MKDTTAGTLGLQLIECFFGVIPAKHGASGILPERLRASRNDVNMDLWQPEASASKGNHRVIKP